MDASPTPSLTLAGDGLTLAADAYGPDDGPPVVLFHGGGQTRHAWGGTARLLGDKGWRAVNVDLRGHGDSEWAGAGGYALDDFAADVRTVAAVQSRPPVLIGASLGGLSALTAIGEAAGVERGVRIAESESSLARTQPRRTPPANSRGEDAASGDSGRRDVRQRSAPAASAPAGVTVAAGLILVDVAPRLEQKGIDRIAEFMLGNLDGFASLDEVADAVAAYNPHRPRPKDLSGLRKNVRRRENGRWYWHWDPAFLMAGQDETRSVRNEGRLDDAARAVTVPTLLVRGRQSDVLSEEGARHTLELMPRASYVDVGGAGHMVAGDRNDAFNDAVVAFLERELPV